MLQIVYFKSIFWIIFMRKNKLIDFFIKKINQFIFKRKVFKYYINLRWYSFRMKLFKIYYKIRIFIYLSKGRFKNRLRNYSFIRNIDNHILMICIKTNQKSYWWGYIKAVSSMFAILIWILVANIIVDRYINQGIWMANDIIWLCEIIYIYFGGEIKRKRRKR